MIQPRMLALGAYYYATQPIRWVLRQRMAHARTMPLSVLFYHRVADTYANGWTISNDEFQRQIRWIRRHFDIVSLEEIQRSVASGENPRPAVAITFDDGYAENCDRAIPFLIENEIPFTYFVSLGHVIDQEPFPHDREAKRPLPINTPEQLREMASAGVEIGAHTRTHCDVNKVTDPEQLVDEVVTATKELERLVRSDIRYFAFPFGQVDNLSAAAVRLLKRNGIKGYCSAFGSYNIPGEDSFHLRRIHGDPEFIRLKNWLSIDPKKLHHGRDFRLPESGVTVEQVRRMSMPEEVGVESHS
ncbi:MAG: polysaccharide deacetylase family protein [Planctomycetota bacterium]